MKIKKGRHTFGLQESQGRPGMGVVKRGHFMGFGLLLYEFLNPNDKAYLELRNPLRFDDQGQEVTQGNINIKYFI